VTYPGFIFCPLCQKHLSHFSLATGESSVMVLHLEHHSAFRADDSIPRDLKPEEATKSNRLG
jgi:uncharacterized protein YbaR (Trm112 family)